MKKAFSILISALMLLGLFSNSESVLANQLITHDKLSVKPENSLDQKPFQDLLEMDVYYQDGAYYQGLTNPIKLNNPDWDDANSLHGPNEFGYTWETNYPYNWVDMSDGTDTGINNIHITAGPIDIGFDFKFFENSYSELYVSRDGYLSFDSITSGLYNEFNIIAPSKVPSDNINYVRYKTDGITPNRRFIIEWNQLNSIIFGINSFYTFETILHESGDIEFQYKSESRGDAYYTISTFITDSKGKDKIIIYQYSSIYNDESAVKIFRPADNARFDINPLIQGGFTKSNEIIDFLVTITNKGDMGADTFNCIVNNLWPTKLYFYDTNNELSDTDSDGNIDTGPINQGDSVTLLVQINSPSDLQIGDWNTGFLTITSSINTSITKTASFSLANPAPFGQVYQDFNSDLKMSFIQPEIQNTYVLNNNPYSDIAVAETKPGEFFYAYTSDDCADNLNYICLYYGIKDKSGNMILPSSELIVDVGPLGQENFHPAVAVAPNGNIGIAWKNLKFEDPEGTANIYYAILNAVGDIIHGPEKLTINGFESEEIYRPSSPYGFRYPNIVATDANKFLISWISYKYVGGDWASDINYMISDSSGNHILAPTIFIDHIFPPGGMGAGAYYDYYDISMTDVIGDKIFIAWSNWDDGTLYQVIDGNGAVIKSATLLDNQPLHFMDAVQLTDGTVFFASSKNYITIDGETFTAKSPVKSLLDSNSLFSVFEISTTRDDQAHGIITFQCLEDKLCYSLIDRNGEKITEIIPFANLGSYQRKIDNYNGYSNTTFTNSFDNYNYLFLPLLVK